VGEVIRPQATIKSCQLIAKGAMRGITIDGSERGGRAAAEPKRKCPRAISETKTNFTGMEDRGQQRKKKWISNLCFDYGGGGERGSGPSLKTRQCAWKLSDKLGALDVSVDSSLHA